MNVVSLNKSLMMLKHTAENTTMPGKKEAHHQDPVQETPPEHTKSRDMIL